MGGSRASDGSGPVRVGLGVLVERRAEGVRLLVSRRPSDAVYAGYWELPGGKALEDEAPAQCLVREFREELGIEVKVTGSLPTVEHVYPHGHVVLHPFYCERDGRAGNEPRNLQVAEHRWIAPAELAELKLPEANEPITRRIIADLG